MTPEWNWTALGAAGQWLSGGTPSKQSPQLWQGPIPWVSPKDMKRPRLMDAIDHVSERALGAGTQLAPTGSLLMVVRGMILAHSFPVAQALRPLAFNQDVKALVPSNAFDSTFLLYVLQELEAEVLRVVDVANHGTKRLPSELLFGLQVPLPPLPEQRKIAAILSSVDDAIAATQAVIDQLGVVKKAMMAELLTRGLPGRHTKFKQTEIGEVPEEWEVVRLSEMASWQNGKAFPSADYAAAGVRLVRPGNLAVGGIVVWDARHTTHLPSRYADQNRKFLVEPGELLMNLTAQSLEDEFLGRVCVTPPGPHCLLNQRIARLAPRNVDGRYLHWVLSGPQFRAHVARIPKGSKVQHIYNGDLESAVLPLPCSAEQLAIGRLLDSVRDRSIEEEGVSQRLKRVKSALMSVLLTGEVRVQPDAEDAA